MACIEASALIPIAKTFFRRGAQQNFGEKRKDSQQIRLSGLNLSLQTFLRSPPKVLLKTTLCKKRLLCFRKQLSSLSLIGQTYQ